MVTSKPRRIYDDTSTMTVRQAQDRLFQIVKTDPVFCPCCKQVVALQRVVITPEMAKATILLHRHFSTVPDWAHVPTLLSEANRIGADVRGKDWEKLCYWGFLEERPHQPGLKKGFYRMLPKGHAFVKEEVKVPKVALVYNGKHVGFGEGVAGVRDCFGDSSEYDKIMAGDYGVFVI